MYSERQSPVSGLPKQISVSTKNNTLISIQFQIIFRVFCGSALEFNYTVGVLSFVVNVLSKTRLNHKFNYLKIIKKKIK